MLHRVDTVAREREAFEQVQAQQGGQPLGGRRGLVHRDASIGCRDRLAPLAGVRGEVLRGHEAVGGEPVGHGRPHPSRVVCLGAAVGDVPQGAGQVGLNQQFAESGSPPPPRVDAIPLGIQMYRSVLVDVLAEQRGARESVPRAGDGRSEQVGQAPGAESLEQHRPRTHAARHGDGLDAGHRQAILAPPGQTQVPFPAQGTHFLEGIGPAVGALQMAKSDPAVGFEAW